MYSTQGYGDTCVPYVVEPSRRRRNRARGRQQSGVHRRSTWFRSVHQYQEEAAAKSVPAGQKRGEIIGISRVR